MYKYINKISLLFFITFLLFIPVSASAQNLSRFQGFAEKGALVFSVTSTSRAQQSYPGATATVYLAGTSTLATIYADNSLTPKSNPFTVDSSGLYSFYALTRLYDIRFSGTGITTPFTIAANGTISSLPTNYSVFDIKDYGATDNGTTDDDSSAINSAIAALNSVGRGILSIPAGSYYSANCNLTPITANGRLVGHGRTDANAPSIGVYGSRIRCGSPTATLFTINSSYFKFEDIVINNNSSTTPSSGAGILVTNLTNAYQKVDYYNISVEKFYDNIDIQVGDDWRMDNCWILSPIRYGVRIRNLIVPDTGGWAISNSAMVSTVITAIAVKVESCGGAKISNTNILGYAQALVADNSAGNTSVLLIANCSFENLHGIAIEVSNWQLINIAHVEFGYYEVDTAATSASAIKFTNVTRSNITGCLFRGPYNTAQVAVLLNNSQGIRVSSNQISGFDRELGFTGTYARDPDEHTVYSIPTYQNGWATVGAGIENGGYLYDNGWVVLRGSIQAGTLNSVIFTLPVGYRPAGTLIFIVPSDVGFCQVSIFSDGRVKQDWATVQGLSLNGIRFRPYTQ